jgi:hypothetical protein
MKRSKGAARLRHDILRRSLVGLVGFALAAAGALAGTASASAAPSSPASAAVQSSAAAPASMAAPANVSGAGNLGVYAWNSNPEGVTDFGNWIDRTPYLAEDFLESDTWAELEGADRLAAWQGTAYASKLLLATYPYPKGQGSLANAAAGDYDSHYTTLGKNLVAAGESNAIIRFGHEFNGNWEWYNVGTLNDADNATREADFAESFRQFVTTMRAVPGQHFKFVWNPATSIWGVDLPAAFPGASYVDDVCIDQYDQTWANGPDGKPIYGTAYASSTGSDRTTRQNEAWTAEETDTNWGMDMIANFAQQQGVPLAVCEWGTAIRSDGYGGGDNPVFIQKMHDWMASKNVAFNVYFNVQASDGNHNLFDTIAFPQASAKFQSIWNPTGHAQTTSALPPSATGATAPYEQVEAESGTLAGASIRYLGDPWASGRKLATMYGAGTSLTLSDVDAAPRGIGIVYQGWQDDLKASIYVNGTLAQANVDFPARGRSWSGSYGTVSLPNVTVPAGATVKIEIDSGDVTSATTSLKLDYVLLLQ